MNRKFEDKLVRLAFGELSPKETATLERKAQSDPDAARALAEFKSLKSGLNMLTDVPPDQLSKERLQNAILGQGLRPLPAENPNRWGWAWMPVMAGAVAFAFLGLRHSNVPTPRIVEGTSLTAMNLQPKRGLRAPSHPLAALATKPVTPKVVQEEDMEDQPTHLASTPHSVKTEPKPTPAVFKQITAPKAQLADSRMKSSAKVTDQVAVNNDPSVPAGKLASINGPLVVINRDIDNNSGAQKATEVDGASDVGPVGG